MTNIKRFLALLLLKIAEYFILFLFGGSIYFLIEVLWRGYSHWTMFVLGGFCFISVGLINEILPYEIPIEIQTLCGGGIITVLEFLVGVICNLILKLAIWDYSSLPLNLLGQICLPFSLLWILLSFIIIFIDDIFRWKVFNEEKPHYKSLFFKKK